MKNFSLRLRLILLVSLAILAAWLIAATVNFFQIRHDLQEVFDSQQLLFAKRLAAMDLQNIAISKKVLELPEVKSKELKKLKFDDDVLAFAIFDLKGRMLLNDGESGQEFKFTTQAITSKDGVLLTNVDEWRILWLRSFDGNFIVAVGQELDYRQDLSGALVVGQMTPWLIILPVLMLIIVITVSRELKPLKSIANKLMLRQPDDAGELSKEGVPKEVQPFIDALNALFMRISGMLTKERRFISDAAHELRTPLAALKVQTEVAQLSDDDPAGRRHALANLTSGIDRATRLIDQLLTLSRLDSYSILPDVEKVDWPMLIESVISDVNYKAVQQNAHISFVQKETFTGCRGNILLLSLLVRNLIDNALRYTPEGSSIDITLCRNELIIEDNGGGVSEEFLSRLGERFFRPPGQDEIGSGLGLSIVKQIAHFHRMNVRFYNRSSGGFGINVSW